MSWERFSWRAVLAGVVTALAVSVIMTLIGLALGFTVIDPMSSTPFSGLGITFGIWSIVSLLLSLAAGGFMAGYIAGRSGGEHGFMVWASMIVAGVFLSGLALSSAVQTAGSAVKTVGSGAASVASAAAGGAVQLASGAVEGITSNIDLNLDTDDLPGDVVSVLRDTGIETLQPEYLQAQMRGARSDLRRAVSDISLDSDNFNQVINEYVERQKVRLANITGDIDRNAAVTALMNTRGLSRAEAERTVDNAVAAFTRVQNRAEYALNEAQAQIEDARQYASSLMTRARIEADELASTLARSALLAAVAMLIGGVVCWFAGLFGSRFTARDAILIEERRGVEINLDKTVPSRDTSMRPRSV